MAKKRLKKKQQKQLVQQKLQSKGYSQKEIKRLPSDVYQKEVKRISDNQRKAEKRNQNRKYIKKYGLTEEYKYKGKTYKGSKLVDLDPDVLKDFARIQDRRNKDRTRQSKYKQKMIDAGVPEHIADKYKTKSNAYTTMVAHKGDRTVYKADKSLSVLWSDVTGDSHYSLALEQYNDMNTNEMISEIHKLNKESKGKSGSGGFLGVAKIQVSGNREKLKASAKEAYKKGYNKAGAYEDTVVMTSDKFTVRGYANMMLSVMSRAKPEHVQDYYNQLETYAYENLPEIHKQIFE